MQGNLGAMYTINHKTHRFTIKIHKVWSGKHNEGEVIKCSIKYKFMDQNTIVI